MLSFQMRQVFKWELCEANSVYGGRKMKLFTHILLQEDGKVSLSLCGGAVSYMMRRVLIIFGKTKLRLKSVCKADLAARNSERYEKGKEEWEMAYSIYRLHATRAQSGPRAQFKHTEETGAYVLNEGKGSIN
jgi:hypothetical protein